MPHTGLALLKVAHARQFLSSSGSVGSSISSSSSSSQSRRVQATTPFLHLQRLHPICEEEKFLTFTHGETAINLLPQSLHPLKFCLATCSFAHSCVQGSGCCSHAQLYRTVLALHHHTSNVDTLLDPQTSSRYEPRRTDPRKMAPCIYHELCSNRNSAHIKTNTISWSI